MGKYIFSMLEMLGRFGLYVNTKGLIRQTLKILTYKLPKLVKAPLIIFKVVKIQYSQSIMIMWTFMI